MNSVLHPKPLPNPRPSRWTTLGGVLAAVGTIVASVGAATGLPFLLPIGTALAAIGQAMTGIKARDHSVSDEEAGAK